MQAVGWVVFAEGHLEQRTLKGMLVLEIFARISSWVTK